MEYFDYLRTRSWRSFLYRRFFLYPRIDAFLKGRVLDVGCGIGDFLSYRPNAIGVDINPAMVAWCQGKGFDARLMPINFLPFNASSFNAVILDNVLEHLDEPKALLNEIYRVLSPNGSLVVGVPGRRGYANDPDHKIFYDESKLVEVLHEFGFICYKILYMPMKSDFLDRCMRQFCIYGVFKRD